MGTGVWWDVAVLMPLLLPHSGVGFRQEIHFVLVRMAKGECTVPVPQPSAPCPPCPDALLPQELGKRVKIESLQRKNL